jgi:hypothetical protein
MRKTRRPSARTNDHHSDERCLRSTLGASPSGPLASRAGATDRDRNSQTVRVFRRNAASLAARSSFDRHAYEARDIGAMRLGDHELSDCHLFFPPSNLASPAHFRTSTCSHHPVTRSVLCNYVLGRSDVVRRSDCARRRRARHHLPHAERRARGACERRVRGSGSVAHFCANRRRISLPQTKDAGDSKGAAASPKSPDRQPAAEPKKASSRSTSSAIASFFLSSPSAPKDKVAEDDLPDLLQPLGVFIPDALMKDHAVVAPGA